MDLPELRLERTRTPHGVFIEALKGDEPVGFVFYAVGGIIRAYDSVGRLYGVGVSDEETAIEELRRHAAGLGGVDASPPDLPRINSS